MSVVPKASWHFATTADRDEFIWSIFPKRKCGDCPGTYHLPNGEVLSVFLEDVTLWPVETP